MLWLAVVQECCCAWHGFIYIHRVQSDGRVSSIGQGPLLYKPMLKFKRKDTIHMWVCVVIRLMRRSPIAELNKGGNWMHSFSIIFCSHPMNKVEKNCFISN